MHEDDATYFDEDAGQTDTYEKIIDNISDEDDEPQTSTAPEFINLPVTSLPILSSLVADYESEDGK